VSVVRETVREREVTSLAAPL